MPRKNRVVPRIAFHNVASQNHSSLELLELFLQDSVFFDDTSLLVLQNELSCNLILLCVSPLLYWSLWTHPKPDSSAILSIPCREQPLRQECSEWESVCARCRSAKWKRDFGRRCELTESFPSFFVVRILCDSMIMYINKIMILASNDLGFRPFRYVWMCLLMPIVLAPWWQVPHELHFSSWQIQFVGGPVFVPYSIQLCYPIIGWI